MFVVSLLAGRAGAQTALDTLRGADGEVGGRWLDTDGRYINAHGAGVLFHEGVYYMFGEIKKGPTRLVPGQDWEDYRVEAGGVSCYSSLDLVHWKNEGAALAADAIDSSSDVHTSRVIERPKVIYNRETKQFVLWMHVDKDDYSYARAGVAVSDRPQGPYRYIGSVRPNGQMSRDMTLFRDDDGRAYLVYTSENNNTMQVCLLSKDYLAPTTIYKRILVGQRREAPAVFKKDGKYYLITSLCTGWDPNPATYAVADSMLGHWEQRGNPCVGRDSSTTFHSQSTFVLPVKNGFLFMADRWNKTDLERSGYLWLPLRVQRGRVEIQEGPTDTICRRMSAAQLSIINYKLRIKAKTDGYSFLRCYDSSGRLLLEYKMPFRYADTITGNYTETPAGNSYLTIGVSAAGRVSVDSVQLELNPGEKQHMPLCNIDQYLQPFWKGDTVYHETVLLRTDGSAPAAGELLYQPDKVLVVTNYGLDTLYREGVDYAINGRTLLRLPGSRMPFRADSSFSRSNLAWYNLQGQWVTVTYRHHDRWPGPIPAYQGGRMPRLMDRLRTGRPVTIVSYGMSITRGMDVSGYDGVAPYMPTYMELFVHGLRRRWPRSAVTLYNAGLPGATVDWGAKYAAQYINPLHPDLVVLDFGMNDFWRMPPVEFRDSIQSIIHTVSSAWPAAEFLLLSNMKFDPDYVLDSDSNKNIYTGNLAGYHDRLKELEAKGVIGLDMTHLSDAIYRRKKARDCIVNPLHPNDYLARWYAQGMIELLCPDL